MSEPLLLTAFRTANAAILVYFLLLSLFYVLFIILSLAGFFRYQNLVTHVQFKEMFHLPSVKPVSVIAPAFNEAGAIIESVQSLLSLEYPVYEVVVVNDGSTDDTLDLLIRHFRLTRSQKVFRKVLETRPIRGIYVSPSQPKLVVVDKENGRKADALNAGLNVSRYPLFCAIDSDSLLEKDALLKITRPFLEDPGRTVAAGGIIRLINGCRVESGQVTQVGLPMKPLILFQTIEYFRAFLGGRIGLNAMRSLLIISGAFGLFRKDVVLKCGGYRTRTVGEDMDLTIRMHAYLKEKKVPYRLAFIPDPICWTEGPESLKFLSRQRKRWQRGSIETLFHNWRMIFNPRYGIVGLFAAPFYLIFETLGPLIEIMGYVIFLYFLLSGRINHPFVLLFFLVAVVFGITLSLFSVLLEEYSPHRFRSVKDVFLLILFAFLENLGYRQYMAFVRAMGFIDMIRGKNEWGRMERKGFGR